MLPNLSRKSRTGQDFSVFHCRECSDIAIKPKQCLGCGSLFCQSCIAQLLHLHKTCPQGCNITEIKDISAGLRRIYNEIDIKCKYYENCKRTLKINELDNHEDICQAPACRMKDVCGNNVVKNKKFEKEFCSAECYVLGLVKNTQNVGELFVELSNLFPMVEEDELLQWDQKNKAECIKVVGNRMTADKTPVFAFITCLTRTGFDSGEHYWEILDHASQSLLKVGVSTTTKIDYNTGFCDIPTGYAYYALGQLRNGSDSKGNTYGAKQTPGTPIGVYLNMDRGILGFVINGQYQGHAFTTPELTKGTIYPAVALLKGVDCTIVQKKIPLIVKLWQH